MNISRIIGEYVGAEKGPLMVFIAGIHGNELSGIQALQQIFKSLEYFKPSMNGRVVCLAANIEAIREEKRFIDQDMNRIWLSDEQDKKVNEFTERDELINTISQIRNPEDEDVYFFDLHSTSAETTPFVMISDTLRNRHMAMHIGVPVVLGLLEHLHGMLIDATSLSGIPTILFQGGKEGDPETIEHHIALVWKVLKLKSQLDTSEISGSSEIIEKLTPSNSGKLNSAFYEISDLYSFPTGDEFAMNGGFHNFQKVTKGEELAVCNGDKIRAPCKGLIFMPTYQKQGNEGFYVVNPIPQFWINQSAKLRKVNIHNRLHWMAGVKKVAENPLTYRLDEQVTFIWALQIFHLLGYTVIRKDSCYLYVAQRENEIDTPSQEVALEYFTERSYMREEIKAIVSDWRIPFSGTKLQQKVLGALIFVFDPSAILPSIIATSPV